MRGSLRLRLALGSLVWIAFALTVAGFVFADLFRQHVEARFDAELRGHLEQLVAVLEPDGAGGVRLRAPLSDPRLSRPYSGLYWQVDEASAPHGVGRLRSRSLWDTTLDVPKDAPADGEIHRHRIAGPGGAPVRMLERIVRLPGEPGRSWRLIVAGSERSMHEPVEAFVGPLAIGLAVLGIGLALAVGLQVSVGLAPLRRLRATLAAVREGRTRRLEGEFPDEVQPLVDELNALLRHDEEVVERARTQAGNLAHALRTPLAVLGNAASGEDGALARLVREQVDDARRQVDYHLARARAAAATTRPGISTPLRETLDGLARVMARVHAERALAIDTGGVDAALAFRGERQDLQEMLGNLLDNACKWARARVVVAARADAGRLVVSIDDDGPGLSAAERDAVFGRGVRADERVPGSGLGLGIVRDLARLYGGDVALDEAPGGGLRVALTLPAA